MIRPGTPAPWRAAPAPVPTGIVGSGARDRAKQVEATRTRLVIGAGCFALLYLVLAARLAEITLFGAATAEAARDPVRPAASLASRAEIRDRNGVLLAVSLPVASVYANPRDVLEPAETARQLATVLPGLDAAILGSRLAEPNRQFLYIRRQVTPREQAAINSLGLPGIHFERAERRIYPQGRQGVHVLGGTDIDGNGIAGVERQFDARLKADPATPLTLSIDLRVQDVLRERLGGAIDRFNAIGGAGVVMDVTTGEVLAMASLPDYAPEDVGSAPPEQRLNRITVGTYEPGSVMKLVTAAMAIEQGTARLNSSFDASKPLKWGRYTINDYRGKGRWLTLPEVIAYSSNLGAARMAQMVGPERHRAFLVKLGLDHRLPIELPEVSPPRMPSSRNWSELSTLTIAFGHGIALSPLQVASTVAGLANQGVWMPPTVLAQTEPVQGLRMITPATSEQLRRLMRIAVTDGSGKAAEVPGYYLGGKTGTAEKPGARGYNANARISSFVGVFPMNAPRYLVYLMLDEPKPRADTHGFATGGWVAAPPAGEIVAQIAPMLGLPPIQPDTGVEQALFVPFGGRTAPPLARPRGLPAAAPVAAARPSAPPAAAAAAPVAAASVAPTPVASGPAQVAATVGSVATR